MQRHCQLVRCTLTISLYITFSTTLSLSVSRCYKAPSAAATVSNAPTKGRRAIPAEGNGTSFIPVLWHEKALLFLQTASRTAAPRRRYFYRLQNSLAGISMPRSWAVHGPGVWGDLQYGYRSYFQRTSSLPRSPQPFRRPSNFPRSSSNRPACDSASYI